MTGKTRHMLTVLGVVIVLLWSCAVAWGADLSVSVDATPRTTTLGQTITLTVTLTGGDASHAGNPVLDPTQDFSVRGPSGQSTSISIMNGRTTASKTFTYYLTPVRTGTFTVGGLSVKADGETFTAPGVRVQITDTPAQSGVPGGQDGSVTASSDEVIIRTSVDTKTPYVGQQVTLTFELDARVNLIGESQYEAPTTTGFWTIELPKIAPSSKLLHNAVYQTRTIKTALFPTTSGSLSIGPASLDYTWGGFFAPIRRNSLATPPIPINVKPLPRKGKPASFNGAVGTFSLTSRCDRTTVTVGDVITLVVTVSGTGNLDLVTAIVPPDLSAFKMYDPRTTESLINSGFTVGGAKSWEYVLIPRDAGTTTIGPFTFSYFDPTDDSYHTAETSPYTIPVLPGDAVLNDSGAAGDGSASVNVGTDIRYIKPDKPSLTSNSRIVYDSPIFWLVYLFSTGLFAAVWYFKRRADAIERNTGLKRRLSAWKRVTTRLQTADSAAARGSVRDVCAIVNTSLTGYVADMLAVGGSTIGPDALENILTRHGVDPDIARRSRSVTELCDFVRFSSAETDGAVVSKLLDDAKAVLADMKEVLEQ